MLVGIPYNTRYTNSRYNTRYNSRYEIVGIQIIGILYNTRGVIVGILIIVRIITLVNTTPQAPNQLTGSVRGAGCGWLGRCIRRYNGRRFRYNSRSTSRYDSKHNDYHSRYKQVGIIGVTVSIISRMAGITCIIVGILGITVSIIVRMIQ